MNKVNILTLLPVFFGFFIMGFVDVVGIATEYVKVDFNLSEQMSGFLPSMVFLWFFLLAIPSASLMNRIGRKNTVLLSMATTLVGMIIPFISYNYKDIEWGKRLQRKLEHYRMPATLCSEHGWERTPIKPVFFAPSDIQPGGLTEELQERLLLIP